MTKESHYTIGVQLLKNQQYEEAIVSFSISIGENENLADCYCERGVSYFHLKQFDKAINDMDKAAELEPENPYRYSSRAFIKGAAGDINGGMKDYEKAIALDPEDAIAYNNLGLLQEQLGYQKKSQRNFLKADDLSEKNQEFANLYKSTKNTHGNSKVLDTSKNQKIDLVKAKTNNEEVIPSVWQIVASVFLSKKGFKEFVSFIKSGFKMDNE